MCDLKIVMFVFRFVMVFNFEVMDGGKVIVVGNECVLRVCFLDVKFFWDNDFCVLLSVWVDVFF